MVIGDRRPYVTALLTLDPEGISHWTQMNAKQDTPVDRLAEDPDLRAVLQRAVDEANRLVSRPESIRRFTIVPDGFSEEAGHLTPSMKLRREVVEKAFATEIEGLYEK